MEEEMQMPISMDWTTEEIVDAVHFFQTIEKTYRQAVVREDILAAYNRFKEIAPSKSEEKQYFKQFDEKAGVSCWKTIQKAKAAGTGEKVEM